MQKTRQIPQAPGFSVRFTHCHRQNSHDIIPLLRGQTSAGCRGSSACNWEPPAPLPQPAVPTNQPSLSLVAANPTAYVRHLSAVSIPSTLEQVLQVSKAFLNCSEQKISVRQSQQGFRSMNCYASKFLF